MLGITIIYVKYVCVRYSGEFHTKTQLLDQVADEEAEFSRYCENPKVASMSDVLPIQTRDSIKLFTHDEDYLDYIQSCFDKRGRRKGSKLGRGYAGKTASEPNVLEVSFEFHLNSISNI